MSRIGKLPIIIPTNVNIVHDKIKITVKGKFGTIEKKIPELTFEKNQDIFKSLSLSVIFHANVKVEILSF